MKVELYVDGSARRNGNGGWGVVGLIEDSSYKNGFRLD